jgi:hypothetical protein
LEPDADFSAGAGFRFGGASGKCSFFMILDRVGQRRAQGLNAAAGLIIYRSERVEVES